MLPILCYSTYIYIYIAYNPFHKIADAAAAAPRTEEQQKRRRLRRCSAPSRAMAKSVTLSALGGLLGASYLSGAFVTPTVSPAQPAPALRGAASIASGNGVSPVTGAAATAVATAAVALVASRKSKKTSSAWLGGNSWRVWMGGAMLHNFGELWV